MSSLKRALDLEGHCGATPIELEMHAIPLGGDLCIILSGGDAPHIGAAVLSQSGLDASGRGRIDVTSSVLALPGHKEDRLFRELAEVAARKMTGVVVVSGGIHVDGASPTVVESICRTARAMLDELLSGA